MVDILHKSTFKRRNNLIAFVDGDSELISPLLPPWSMYPLPIFASWQVLASGSNLHRSGLQSYALATKLRRLPLTFELKIWTVIENSSYNLTQACQRPLDIIISQENCWWKDVRRKNNNCNRCLACHKTRDWQVATRLFPRLSSFLFPSLSFLFHPFTRLCYPVALCTQLQMSVFLPHQNNL